MIKYYIGQFFRFLGIATVPGVIATFIRSFILGNVIPRITDLFSNLQLHQSVLGTLGLIYATLSLVVCPVSFGIYLLIRYGIYRKHWKEASKKQSSGRYSKDRDLWNDKDWDKP